MQPQRVSSVGLRAALTDGAVQEHGVWNYMANAWQSGYNDAGGVSCANVQIAVHIANSVKRQLRDCCSVCGAADAGASHMQNCAASVMSYTRRAHFSVRGGATSFCDAKQ